MNLGNSQTWTAIEPWLSSSGCLVQSNQGKLVRSNASTVVIDARFSASVTGMPIMLASPINGARCCWITFHGLLITGFATYLVVITTRELANVREAKRAKPGPKPSAVLDYFEEVGDYSSSSKRYARKCKFINVEALLRTTFPWFDWTKQPLELNPGQKAMSFAVGE
ncbi:hypothetical protein VOLCADRAFT_107524 [Volvox carteri f. nagariensis]|uniref:Uncharacterized protein n=1 Tax=Volvox carteri f. nagariensis TaxID=3068 RepID=D8UEL8_VOLCA|nr:uncharacterized protein VOLCADRAFT_107524 [Volvox carteri f. nagariensis]EFJ41906.1 hypothetical protein VOLCADRAFT_107524 [Volvox carteri f. nagariensis]|eukprot:XP_002957104.1 hypothetical protein VOLCADRAFT_107524 [Volvox carteri f. nagariensis]